MKFARPGMIERQLEAKMEFECRMRGALRLAYPPVVASGINNLTLHYVDNDSIIQCVLYNHHALIAANLQFI